MPQKRFIAFVPIPNEENDGLRRVEPPPFLRSPAVSPGHTAALPCLPPGPGSVVARRAGSYNPPLGLTGLLSALAGLFGLAIALGGDHVRPQNTRADGMDFDLIAARIAASNRLTSRDIADGGRIRWVKLIFRTPVSLQTTETKSSRFGRVWQVCAKCARSESKNQWVAENKVK